MKLALLVLVQILLATVASAQAGESRIFLISDTHSAYDQFEPFLKGLSARVREFRQRAANGDVLVLVNGDIAGTGLYAERDHGELDYRLVETLANEYPTALALGNHEGFDFNHVGKPHQVFLKQHRRYLNRTGQSVLTANLFPEKKYRRIFAPYQEHRLGGKRVRVVGISLETFFQETAYSQTGARIFKTEAPRKYLDTMKEQSVLAANDGVESVVFLIHDGAARLTPIVEEYLNWKRSDDRVQKLLVPLVASGHMHQVIDSELHGTRVVEAGSDLAFSEIQLDDNGKVSLVHHWDRRSSDQWLQQPTEPLLPEAFTELYKEANAIVDSVNAENVEILAPPLWEDRGFVLNREEHRRMRVGRVLADTLRNWALKFYSEKEVGRKISDVVGLYNYLSYGWGSKIDALFEGPVTVGNLKSVVHFRGRLGARLLKGADFLELVAAMRDYGAQSSRPFPNPVLSSNVVERDRRFLITDLNGTVRVVDPNGFYLVVTDHYTGMNGYKIPEIDGIYQRAEWTLNDAPVNTEVLLPGLARLRLSEDSCAGVLSNFRK